MISPTHAPPRPVPASAFAPRADHSASLTSIVHTWRRHRRAFKALGDEAPAETYAEALRLELRSRIAVLKARVATDADRDLRLQCLLDLADGIEGLEEDIADDVAGGHAWIATFAMQVVADLVRANAGR